MKASIIHSLLTLALAAIYGLNIAIVAEEKISGQSNSLISIHSSSTHHDVGVPVEELDAFLQAPEATLHAGQHEFGKFVLGS